MSVAAQTPDAPRRPRLTGDPGNRRRKLTNQFMMGLSTFAAVLAVALLALVIVDVVIKAAPALNWDFLTKLPNTSFLNPTGGGIVNDIIGSAILIAISSVISIPIGILVGIYTTEFAPPQVSSVIRFALDILNGVPTIVIGIFIYGLLVLGHTQSGWAAGIALAIIQLPIVARSAQEVLSLVPRSLKEAGLALGLRRWRIVTRIVLPTAAGGLITGAVLGVARVAGETAPLLFTSSVYSNLAITWDPSKAMPNIPTTIFTLSESPTPSDHSKAWAAALILIAFVLIVSLVARTLNERSRRKLRS
jgi:phosphate transport system permease protein